MTERGLALFNRLSCSSHSPRVSKEFVSLNAPQEFADYDEIMNPEAHTCNGLRKKRGDESDVKKYT